MSEDTKDPIRMKKDILSSHIPFIQKMLEKVKNTEFEKKWQQMYDCIMSDKKKLNLDQISKMNKTIIGLKCKMMQIEPKKENLQVKTEHKETATVQTVQANKTITIPIKTEIQANNVRNSICIPKIEVSLEKPPLSNDDITQLLVETADSTVIQSDSKPAKMNNVVPENNQIVIDKLVNTNETDKMDSIEGFMKHIHGQSKSSEEIVKITQSSDVLAKGPEKIVDENIPSTSKDVSCNSTKINNKLNEKSDVSKGHVKTNGTKPKSAPILLPSPIFEDAITPFERKPYRIPKISQSINTVKVTTEPLPQIKRRISTQSSKAEEPSQKKLRSMSSVDNVKQPVEKTNIKTKKASNKNKKDESLKTFVEKLPVSITDVPQTSELILSLENLVGKEGIKKMKSIFIDSTDDTNKVSTVKESLKRPEEKSNLKTNSAKKKKLIEQICNDEVVISEKKSVVIRKKSPKKKNELDRLNEDIDRMFIRDSVLNATGKRVCTMKPTVEEIEKIELAKQMKSCRLILHKLQFNIEDMPVNINELQLLNINSIYLAKSSLTPVSSKVTVKSKPKIKSKIMLNKLKGRYTRLSSKQLIIKDEEWEDVDDDQDDKDENAVSSSNVKIEQIVTDEAMISEKNTSIIEIVENLKNCVEKVHTENLKLSPSVIVKTSEDTVSSSIELQSSNKNLVDITINSKSKPFIIPFKSVFNLSYAMIPSGTVYKCMCNDCKYQTTVKPSFVSHLNDNHMSYNWHGFCNICKKFVENVNDRSETNLIINEFNHMLECHILIEQTSVVEHSQNAGNSKNSLAFVNSPNFMPKITHNNSNNHIVSNTAGTNTGVNIVGKLIPMVKVSMNRLMAPIQQKEILKSTLTKPQPVASTVVKTPASTSWTQTVLNTTPKAQSTPSPLANNITYLNHDNMPNDILRPWLSEQISSKSHEVCKEMLTDICLTAFYKCMATTCSYYTDDVVLFTTHLKAHLQFQLSDKINFTKCSYCTFRGSGIESLIAHIKCLHKYDRFSCFHCFYRTVVDFNVLTHMELFHKMKPKMVLECNRPQSKNYCIELETIKKTRSSFVPPIICVFCKSKFYVFQTFITHINNHTEVFNTKCIKCNKTSTKQSLHTHLVTCHGFGLFQCVYCKFGTNTFEIINHHLANLHPNKLPMFCERSQSHSGENIPVSSIDSTCLKHINQMVHGNLIRKLFFSDEELKNYDNVGKLDKNLVVMKIKKFIQNGQSKRTILVKSDKLSESIQKNSNLLSIEDELPLANKNIVVASDTSSAPSTSTKPVEKCKLLIERVYSLSMPLDIDDKK